MLVGKGLQHQVAQQTVYVNAGHLPKHLCIFWTVAQCTEAGLLDVHPG